MKQWESSAYIQGVEGVPLFSMNIAFAFPESFPPGYARCHQVAQTARAVAARGCRVFLLKGREPDGTTGFGRLGIPSRQGLEIHLLPLWRSQGERRVRISWNGVYDAACLLRLLRIRHEHGLHAVYVRHIELTSWLLYFRHGLNVPIVFEAHQPFYLSQQIPRRQRVLFHLEKEVYQRVDGLVSISGVLGKFLQKQFQLERLSELTPSGVDLGLFRPRQGMPEARCLLYLGQFYPWKGVDTLVEAMHFLPDFLHLKLIGGREGSEDYRRISTKIRELGLGQRIHLLGLLPQDQLGSHLKEAYLAVLPASRREGISEFSSPLKLFEYMAAGIPIVASDLPSFREILRHSENAYLVEADDPEALAKGIMALTNAPRLAEKLAQTALREINSFSWLARAEKIVGYLQKLVRQ
jgi:glycosyltransferase involved in cell wall biosynthesis